MRIKTQCPICNESKGKRSCHIQNNSLICPLCCASTRNETCQGCPHYAKAYHHPAAQAHFKPFVIELDPVVEREVRHAVDLLNRGDIHTGRSIISRLMEGHPNNYLVAYANGLCHVHEAQFDEAIAAFEAAIQIYPYCEEAYYNLGVTYKQKFNIPKTVAAFRKTIEVGDPHDVFVKYASSNLRDLERVIFENYRLPIDTYIKSHELFDQGFDAMQDKCDEQAIALFTASLAICDKNPQCHGNIGICLARLGRKDEALKAFTLALEIDPDYEPAMVNMAIVEQLPEGEALTAREVRRIEYYKDYPLQNKSYIQSLLDTPEKSMENVNRLGFTDNPIK